MSIKNHIDLNSQVDTLFPDNTTQLISASKVRQHLKDLNDSAVNKLGDLDISGQLGYSTILAITSDGQIPHKKYVDDSILASVSDVAYGVTWNGVITIAPSKNAVYDKIELLDAAKLNRSGGTMTGNLTMGGNSVLDAVDVQLQDNGSIVNTSLNARIVFTALGGLTITGVPRLSNLTASTILELNATKDIVSVVKQTGYNLALGTVAGTVLEGNNDALYVKLAGAQTVTGAKTFAEIATFGKRVLTKVIEIAVAEIDWSLANDFHKTLIANITFTFSNLADQTINITLIQDATGGRTVTWPAGIKWQGGTAPTQTTTASKADVYTLKRVNGIIYGAVSQNY